MFDEAANAEWCEFIAEKIRGIVDDPDTAEKLIPKDHRYGEHRPPFVTGYYEAYNKPNVSLVDLRQTPIVRMTERGIETADGEREYDIIIWATGFDFGTGALNRMGIRGRDGLALEDHWADGPTTFLGVQTTGFPNFFFPGGPHGAAGNNPRYNGDQVDFVTETLVYVRDHGYDTIEVDPEAEDRGPHGRHRRGAAVLRRAQLLLRRQHPREAAPVPVERRRPPEAVQGDRRGPRHRLQGVPAQPFVFLISTGTYSGSSSSRMLKRHLQHTSPGSRAVGSRGSRPTCSGCTSASSRSSTSGTSSGSSSRGCPAVPSAPTDRPRRSG